MSRIFFGHPAAAGGTLHSVALAANQTASAVFGARLDLRPSLLMSQAAVAAFVARMNIPAALLASSTNSVTFAAIKTHLIALGFSQSSSSLLAARMTHRPQLASVQAAATTVSSRLTARPLLLAEGDLAAAFAAKLTLQGQLIFQSTDSVSLVFTKTVLLQLAFSQSAGVSFSAVQRIIAQLNESQLSTVTLRSNLNVPLSLQFGASLLDTESGRLTASVALEVSQSSGLSLGASFSLLVALSYAHQAGLFLVDANAAPALLRVLEGLSEIYPLLRCQLSIRAELASKQWAQPRLSSHFRIQTDLVVAETRCRPLLRGSPSIA